jgi:hypothetical protein
MPKNSATHAERIAKVKLGFTAAQLTSAEVTQIMAVFDVISESDGREVAQRTEFSVSTSSKASESIFGKGRPEERRQMARALMFVDDLKNLYDDIPLPRKLTDSEFEAVWRGDFAGLSGMLKARAAALCKADFEVREILNTPVISSPMPAPRRIVIADETLSLLNKTVGNQGRRIGEIRRGVSSAHTQRSAWSDSKSGLVAIFATVVSSTMSNMMSVKVAATGAYTEFEALFEAVGKENEAKIAMAKSFFGALSSYAPFPLSVVGKIGSAACGVLHADTSIGQVRHLGPPKYFDSNIPTLVKFNAKLGAVRSWTADLTRLGVDGGAMPSGTSIQNAIDLASGRTVTLLNNVFLDALNETYGATPEDQANKGSDFYESVKAGLVGPVVRDASGRPKAPIEPHDALVAQMVLMKTTAVFNATKSAIESAGAITVVSATVIQPFIELQLMAEYLAAFMPGDDFTKTIPEALIRRLESAPIEIVLRKTGTSQTDAIYGLKKLPWVPSHPRHTGALVYFFRWYKRCVNPFDLVTGKVTATGIRDAMGIAIGEIGAAVQANKVKRRLRGADTADWTKVAAGVATIRGV